MFVGWQQAMKHAPDPTEEQIERVRDAIGASSLVQSQRIESGTGATMDILSEGSTRLVLRRYNSHVTAVDAAARETRALELLQRANIPAPAPIWIDNEGVFDGPAVVISYVDGTPDLTPSNPFDWAERLASVLARIHEVRLDGDDVQLFPPGAGSDVERIQESPELVLEHPLGEDLLRRRVILGSRSDGSEAVFSHTDFTPANTLWSEGSLTGVVGWESPATGDRGMDVAYCALDIRYLGMDKVADHFVATYRAITGEALPNLAHWEAVGLCRPMPDIARWVPGWVAMGRNITDDRARERYTRVIEDFLARTG